MQVNKHSTTTTIWTRLERIGFAIPQISQTETFENTQCIKLDGRRVADELIAQAKQLAQNRIQPHLTVLLIGDNPASQTYVYNKQKAFARAGFSSQIIHWQAQECDTQKLIQKIRDLNNDANVHGILVQLPLPKHIDAKKVINEILPHKDVDGFTQLNAGKLFQDDFTGHLPCTPFGVMTLLRAYNIDVQGKNALVIGRSQIVGRPMAQMLMTANATVTAAHRHTQKLQDLCRNAEVLVAAVGQRDLIQRTNIKPGAIVIDVGMNRDNDGKLCGDVEKSASFVSGWLTPVPGGVGPLTIAMLCLNTSISAWDS